jgi:PAS domain S-box-containing protein
MELHDLWAEAAKDVVLLGAVIAAGWVIWKQGLKPLGRWFGRMSETRKRIELIASELVPNHGTSLRDAIDRIERQASHNGAALRAWWLGSPYAMYETDSIGNILWTNRAYQRLTGLGAEDLKGLGWVNMIREEERERIKEAGRAAVDDVRSMEIDFFLHNGKLVHCAAEPLKSPDGGLIGFLGSLTPVEGGHDGLE